MSKKYVNAGQMMEALLHCSPIDEIEIELDGGVGLVEQYLNIEKTYGWAPFHHLRITSVKTEGQSKASYSNSHYQGKCIVKVEWNHADEMKHQKMLREKEMLRRKKELEGGEQ